MILIDLTKTFDIVSRQGLCRIMDAQTSLVSEWSEVSYGESARCWIKVTNLPSNQRFETGLRDFPNTLQYDILCKAT